MIVDAQARGRHVYVVLCNTKVTNFLERQGVLKCLEEGHQLPDRLSALRLALGKLDL